MATDRSRRVALKAAVLVFCAVAAATLAQVVDSANRARQANAPPALPEAFKSVLPKVKAKSHVPIMLPSELPEPIGKAGHAVIQKAEADEYAISIYNELGVGDSGFAAYFSGEGHPGFSPEELPNVSEVKLAHGFRGFLSPPAAAF